MEHNIYVYTIYKRTVKLGVHITLWNKIENMCPIYTRCRAIGTKETHQVLFCSFIFRCCSDKVYETYNDGIIHQKMDLYR